MQSVRLQTGSLSNEEKEVRRDIVHFLQLKAKKKNIDSQFDNEKKKFYKRMDEFFKAHGLGHKWEWTERGKSGVQAFSLTRVQPHKVVFDPAKVAKAALSKGIDASDVVEVHTSVIDYSALARYVKSLGGSAKVFKSFLSVTKEVNVKAIDRLIELGELEASDLDGAYEVKPGPVTFRVALKADESSAND